MLQLLVMPSGYDQLEGTHQRPTLSVLLFLSTIVVRCIPYNQEGAVASLVLASGSEGDDFLHEKMFALRTWRACMRSGR